MGFDGGGARGGIAQGQHNIVSVPVMWLYFLRQSISNRFVQVVQDSMLRIQISPNIRYEMSKLA